MATVLQAFLSMQTNTNYKLVIKDQAYGFVHNVKDFKLKISPYCHVSKLIHKEKRFVFDLYRYLLRYISISMFTIVFFYINVYNGLFS